jgi:glycine hydroxymethyltransferase
LANAGRLAQRVAGHGFRIVSGGTDNHLFTVDAFSRGITGKEGEQALESAGITVNKNAIPFDTLPPNTASGIRIGTPATTSRGFGTDEMRMVGRMIIEAIQRRDEPSVQARLAGDVRSMVAHFPVPGLPAA